MGALLARVPGQVVRVPRGARAQPLRLLQLRTKQDLFPDLQGFVKSGETLNELSRIRLTRGAGLLLVWFESDRSTGIRRAGRPPGDGCSLLTQTQSTYDGGKERLFLAEAGWIDTHACCLRVGGFGQSEARYLELCRPYKCSITQLLRQPHKNLVLRA